MRGEQLGRTSLRLDAAYCAAAGTLVAAAARRLAPVLSAPPAALRATGAATVGWAGVVTGLSLREDWRTGVALVAAANTAAATGLLIGAAVHPGTGARVLLALTGVEVGLFAVSQVAALRT